MRTLRLLRYVGIWTLVGVFLFTQDVAQSVHSADPERWFLVLECWLVRAYVWGLLAPPVVRIARRMRLANGYSLRWAGAHFAIGSMIALTAAGLTGCAGYALGIPWYQPDLRAAVLEALSSGFHASLFAYWIIVGACEVFDNYHSSRRAEFEATRLKAQLVQSQMHALKQQLQPHFIFNALNAIVALIRRRRNTQAEELTGRLGELLRGAMEDTETQEVPLSRELRLLEAYLEIEQIRYGDRLKFNLRIDPAVVQAMVPYMCLQPLAENAIRHGIASRLPHGTLTVTARVRDAMLEITIADDGVGFDPARAGGRPVSGSVTLALGSATYTGRQRS